MAKTNSTAKQNKKQPSDCCRCNETKSKATTKAKATKNAKATTENE